MVEPECKALFEQSPNAYVALNPAGRAVIQGDRYARQKGGLGVGLWLVKTLVRAHGGTVEAHSDGLGCGSEFVVRLPAAAHGHAAAAGLAQGSGV